MPRHFGDDLTEDGSIALHQVETGFARLLSRTGSNHGDGGSGAIGVASGPNVGRVRKRDGVTQVHGFAFGLSVVHVDEDDLGGESAEHESIGKCGAHVAKSDNGDTSGAVGTVHFDSPQLNAIVT